MGIHSLMFSSLVVTISLWQMINANCCTCDSQKVWRKLNGVDPLCFKAAEGGHVEFAARLGINVWKLKYVRRSGYHECEYGHGGYFGCEAYAYRDGHSNHHMQSKHSHYASYKSYSYDEFQDDEQQHDSPQQDESQKDMGDPDASGSDSSQGRGPMYMQTISVYLTDKNANVLLPQAPFHKPYFLEPSINRPAWDNSITLPVNDGPLGILRQEQLRLYHGEDLFDVHTDDNSGELCIDVYAYGDLVQDVAATGPPVG